MGDSCRVFRGRLNGGEFRLTSSRSDTRAEVKASIRRPFKPFDNAV
jgi:hypothetical protein